VGLGDGLPEPDPVELGEGEAEADVEGLLLGLDGALLLGEDEALLVALGVAVALVVALGVLLALALALAVALAVAEALVLAEGEAELVDFVVVDLVGLALGVLDDENESASRTRPVWPAGTVRAEEVEAGGWPHTLGAAALIVLASAGTLPPRRLPTIPDETMAAPATAPNAEDPDRADFMAAPWSPWSSSSRPRVTSQIASDRPDAGTIPPCRSSTPALGWTGREHPALPASSPEYSAGQGRLGALWGSARVSSGGLPGRGESFVARAAGGVEPRQALPALVTTASHWPTFAGAHQAALVCPPSSTGGWVVVIEIRWPVARFISAIRWEAK